MHRASMGDARSAGQHVLGGAGPTAPLHFRSRTPGAAPAPPFSPLAPLPPWASLPGPSLSPRSRSLTAQQGQGGVHLVLDPAVDYAHSQQRTRHHLVVCGIQETVNLQTGRGDRGGGQQHILE